MRNSSNDEEFNLLLIMTVFIILLITSTLATIGLILGFIVMMSLDVALG